MPLFDQAAAAYDQWYTTPFGQFVDGLERELIFRLAGPQPGEAALDLGCGTGVQTQALSRYGLRVTGIDISPEMLARARAKAIPGAVLLEGDAASLPFPDEAFDLVISVTAFEFMPDPAGAAREAMRVLRPGGRLVLGVLAEGTAWTQRYRASPLFATARFFTREDLQALLPQVPCRIEGCLQFGPEAGGDGFTAASGRDLEAAASAPPAFWAARFDKGV
ncbi:MAG TPA: class I SAM-dependent methyltransferase [Symbiobacteriaceae bacterium]|nr:class I SAM-dependent methyltransferase [Symbiobacteriaceae bacterium]